MQDSAVEPTGIRTTEGTVLEFEFAGLGSRVVAYLADWLILLAGWIVVAFILTYTGLFANVFIGGETGVEINKALLALFILIFYFGNWWYFVGFETAWQGQTPGKRFVGLRVLTDEGLPIGFGHAALRTTLRIADFLPFAYGTGALVMFFNQRWKRLGDMVAGTVVVRESRSIGELFAEPQLSPEATTRELTPSLIQCARSLKDEEFELLREYLIRRRQLTGEARRTLARQIVETLCAHSSVVSTAAKELDADLLPEQFLEDLYRATSYKEQR